MKNEGIYSHYSTDIFLRFRDELDQQVIQVGSSTSFHIDLTHSNNAVLLFRLLPSSTQEMPGFSLGFSLLV